ncbi:MAG: T9SS type A sorting domain-containing protein [Candidatus Paceibacterota bacterium]
MKKLITFSTFLFLVLLTTSVSAQTFTFSKQFVAYGTGIITSATRISGGFHGDFCEEIALTGTSQPNGLGRHLIDVEYRLTASPAIQAGDSISFYMKLGTFIPILPGGTLILALLDENKNQAGNLQIDLNPLSSTTWKRYAIKVPTGMTSLSGISFVVVSSQTTVSFFADVKLDFDLVEIWRNGSSQILTSFETDITAVEDMAVMPTDFQLEQNYPNPFNPSTTISFNIPVSGNYSLKVYNLLGEEITTLINKELFAGAHKVNFNANNLATGMYLYTLTGKGSSMTKKMILMK